MAIIEGVVAGVAVHEVLQRVATRLNSSDEKVNEAIRRGDIEEAIQLANQSEIEQIISGFRDSLLQRDVDPTTVDEFEDRLRSQR